MLDPVVRVGCPDRAGIVADADHVGVHGTDDVLDEHRHPGGHAGVGELVVVAVEEFSPPACVGQDFDDGGSWAMTLIAVSGWSSRNFIATTAPELLPKTKPVPAPPRWVSRAATSFP